MKYKLIIALSASIYIKANLNAQVQDIDGNHYNTVQIGKQTWMEKNLQVSHFRNGDPIPYISNWEEWLDAGMKKKAAWSYFQNDSKLGETYGKLYNWYAVVDPRGIAPEGWHVSSSKDWSELIELLGGSEKSSYQLKSIQLWNPSEYCNTSICNGNNYSGMNIKPSGGRYHEAGVEYYYHLGDVAEFWIPEKSPDKWDGKSLTIWRSSAPKINDNYKDIGFAVRCVEDEIVVAFNE